MNRYELSADGQEVTDHKTGLIWRAVEEDEGEFTWDEAQTRAQEVAQQTGLPWRVPTVDELASLVDRALSNPASAFPDMLSGIFWSCSPYVGDSYYAWYVNLNHGNVSFNYRNFSLAVRLVRGG